ncbi:hypothetical protein ACJRO7_005306 [Eucalyptus globulus]|uniref:pectinesterase n=1 Tax=Eucalyptus globulus TaxID=34317 RepID=A0ABD3IZ61_EUCGL
MQAMWFKVCLLLLLFASTISTTPSFNSTDGSGSSVYGSLLRKAKNRLKPCLRLRVSKKPRLGGFASGGAALRSVPIVNTCRVVISISAGTYRGKVEIPATMAYAAVKGADADKTAIEWADTADRIGPNGPSLGTFASATFANNAPLPALRALGKEAVALRIAADAAAFVGCRFVGSQDTLHDHVGRHYIRDCYVEGSMDFVFGNGLPFYRGCHLYSASNRYGAVTAQKRESLLEETGFPLARTVFYGQYKCTGLGASSGGRVSWSRELTPEEAEPFVSLDFIGARGWLFFALAKPGMLSISFFSSSFTFFVFRLLYRSCMTMILMRRIRRQMLVPYQCESDVSLSF